MALVGQAATIAQFAGVDAYGLIKMIAEAAQTVRRNRATCLQLARRAKMIGDLLGQLHAAQLMQQPETRSPVEELEETLRRAYRLVRSCQGRSYLYRCFMGGRHADEIREVQSEITFYLQLFPLVSYVDTTLTWVRLLNRADPSCRQAPMDLKVPGSEASLSVLVDQSTGPPPFRNQDLEEFPCSLTCFNPSGYLLVWILATCLGKFTKFGSEGVYDGWKPKIGVCGEANPQFSWVEA